MTYNWEEIILLKITMKEKASEAKWESLKKFSTSTN